MLKAVVFDLDGVLINSEPYYFEQKLNYFHEAGLKVTAEQVKALYGQNLRQVWQTLFPEATPEQYAQWQAGYVTYKKQHPMDYRARLNPDAVPTLAKLKQLGLQLALASASDMAAIENVFQHTGIGQFFDKVTSGQQFPRSKPDPAIYLATLSQLQLPASDVLAVEDSEVGITAACAAKIKVAALKPLTDDFVIDQSQADFKVSHLTNLVQLAADLKADTK